MGFSKYIPASLALILAGGEGYMTYGFLMSNSRIPEGIAFTLSTVGPSIAAMIFALAASVGLIPGVREKLSDRGLSGRAYWTLVAVLVLLSFLLTGAAVLSGSMEYTQFQAAAS